MRLKIDDLIKTSGLKHKYIAEKIGISTRTLYKWRKNESFPRLDQAVKLAVILKCKVDDLFELKKL